ALKYEQEHQILQAQDCSNIGVFGGSGNHTLQGTSETTLFAVSRCANYVFANMARRTDPSKPRDQPGKVAFSVNSRGAAAIAADQNNLTLFKSGELSCTAGAVSGLQVGTVFSTSQVASQSFLRFFNTGTTAGTITATLSDYVSGRTLGQWSSASINPGAEN